MNGWITIGSKLDTKQLEKDIKNAEKEIDRYEKEAEKLTNQKMKLQVDVSQAEIKLDQLEAKEDELRAKMKTVSVGSERYNELKMQLDGVIAKSGEIGAKYEYQKGLLGDIDGKIKANQDRIAGAKKEAKQLNEQLNNATALDKMKSKIEGIAGSLKNVASKGDLKGVSQKIQGVGDAVKGVTHKIFKWGLALFGIRTAYNFIRQSANTVFQQNEGLANQVQLMKTAIATALEPLIKNLVSLVYTLFTFINGIVAKLTGKNLFATAEKNLKAGAGSAKEINKQLAGFDEMNVLSDNSGGGGAGGGFDTSGFVEGNAKLMETLEMLKKMFEEGDWAGIAQTISAGIISGLDFLYHKIMAIDWKGIGSAISEFLTNIDFSGIFIGLVKVFGEAFIGFQNMMLSIDWGTIAKNFGQGLVDALNMMIQYVHRMDFSAMGQKITDVFTSIPWGELGSSIINLLWESIQGIIDLVLAIDWGKVGETVFNAVHEWINTLITIFQETDWMQLATDIVDAIFDFIEGVDWLQLGMDILLGLCEGIGAMIEFLLGLFNEIVERILDLLGVHSPSTVFKDIGINLIKGLIDGIKSLIESVINTFKSLLEKVKTVFTTMLNWIKEKVITPLSNFFNNLWEGIKNGVKGAYDKIKSIFENVVNFFKGIVSNILNLFHTIGTKVGDSISSAFKNVINSVISGVEKILNSPIKAINGLINTINAIPGINLSRLSTFSLPRLAKGGIINQPGKGVMVGSAIAGERGREGVIPLTDSQQMALLGEAIGKYINLNATIPVYVGNRQVAREMKKIEMQNAFAGNR
jgi:phage-related protein